MDKWQKLCYTTAILMKEKNKKEITNMSDITKLNDEAMDSVSGGKGADGPSWVEGGATYYRIVRGDTLSQIAQRFGTNAYAIQSLNSQLIKNIDVIKEGWVIRIR